MTAALHPCELAPLLARWRISRAQLAHLFGISQRTLCRYLASGRAPAPVCAMAHALATGQTVIDRAGRLSERRDTAPTRAHRFQLVRFGEAYAANGLFDLARGCLVEAGFTMREANARMGRQLVEHHAAAVAKAAAAGAIKRHRHAAYMRAARAAGKYPETRPRGHSHRPHD